MSRPFNNDPVDEGAALLRRELNIRREMVIMPRIDVLAFPESYLFERYRFTSQSIIYMRNLICLYICNITSRRHALSSKQIVCVALFQIAFFCIISELQSTSARQLCAGQSKECVS